MSIKQTLTYHVLKHWYGHVERLNRAFPKVKVGGSTFSLRPNVYRPLENEHACADYCFRGSRVLDLGCGSGISTVFLAKKARRVIATDISAAAVLNTTENCRAHGLTNVIVRQSDMFDRVEGKFDLIVANPPYIAADFEDEARQFATSVRYLPTLMREAPRYLAPGGRLLVQFPARYGDRLIEPAAQIGMRLVRQTPLPKKSLGLQLTSLAFLQIGFKSTFYLFEAKAEEVSPAIDDVSSVRVA